MNSDENDSNQSTPDEAAISDDTEKVDNNGALAEKSEYDFDDSNTDDGPTDKASEADMETGQKRGRSRTVKTVTKSREPEGSPPRKSARIANK